MEGSGFKTVQMNGEYGNLSAAISEFTADGTAADSTIDFLRLPPGAYITDVRLANGAMGAGVTLSVGYRYVDSAAGAAVANGFLDAAAADAEGTRSFDGLPMKFDDEFIITGTVGGAAATGTMALIVEYIYDGTR